jgi:hypothetical protein
LRGVRQVGKTSLLARGLRQAREAGGRAVFTDFQRLNRSEFRSLDAFYWALGMRLLRDLGLDPRLADIWDKDLPPNPNFEGLLQEVILARVAGPLIWIMDEVDRLFACDFGTEVFGLLRSWHNARAIDPTGPWARLTLVIAYATEAHLFIKDLNQSPFNIGTTVTLSDFTVEQAGELNRRRGTPLRSDRDLERFYHLVGGHPYLANRGLYEMGRRALDIADFERQATDDEGLFGNHLRRILVTLGQDEALLAGVRGVLRGGPCPTAESFYRLRAAGLIAGDSARYARIRCRIYETFLGRHLS